MTQVCPRQPLPCLQQLWRSPPLLNTWECISPTTLTNTSAVINKAHQSKAPPFHCGMEEFNLKLRFAYSVFSNWIIQIKHGSNKYKYNTNKERVFFWKQPWLIDKCCGHITCHADFPFQRGKLNKLMRNNYICCEWKARSLHHVAQCGETQRVESRSSNEARRRGKRRTNVTYIIKMQS